MYRREKQSKQENHKSSKLHHNMPSFSSTLLDEIYRSIDGNGEKTEDLKGCREKPPKKQGVFFTTKGSGNNITEDEYIASSRRACLAEKWMEKEVSEKVTRRPSLLRDDDLLLFSSTSSSSDNSGQLSSSSDTEFFGSQTESKLSGLPTRHKPVRTGGPTRKHDLFDDCQNHQKKLNEVDLIKSKSRASKFYSNLKKMKQPISPGARLTNFINTLFSNANGKNVDNGKGFQNTKSSSACSYSRSCLDKHSPKSKEKIRNGIERTVRFHPLSLIVDEDSRPCGKKSVPDEDLDRYGGRPPLPPKQSMKEKNRKIEEAVQKVLQGYNRQNKDEGVVQKVLQGYSRQKKDDFSILRKIHDENDEDEDDAKSDSSSDLFELDHLALFGNNKFCKELPVYETTRLDRNHAIVRGLIR